MKNQNELLDFFESSASLNKQAKVVRWYICILFWIVNPVVFHLVIQGDRGLEIVPLLISIPFYIVISGLTFFLLFLFIPMILDWAIWMLEVIRLNLLTKIIRQLIRGIVWLQFSGFWALMQFIILMMILGAIFFTQQEPTFN